MTKERAREIVDAWGTPHGTFQNPRFKRNGAERAYSDEWIAQSRVELAELYQERKHQPMGTCPSCLERALKLARATAYG